MSDSSAPRLRSPAAARVIVWVRRGTLLGLLLGLAYIYRRFESFSLPAGRCSPIVRLAPGTRLWIDTQPPKYFPGDIVFFLGQAGEVYLGELRELRGEDAWILTDAPDCPGVDSETLGWIPPERLAGRLVFATR